MRIECFLCYLDNIIERPPYYHLNLSCIHAMEPLVAPIFVSFSLVVPAVLSSFPPLIKTEKAVWSRETLLGETSKRALTGLVEVSLT